jgi:hypothetical protein
MRPTDVCHPYDLRAPASRALPASSHDFRRVDTPQGLRPCAVVLGDRTVHAVQTASADSPSHNTDAIRVPVFASCLCLTAFWTRAWAFSSHGARINRASDIPVASSRSSRRARHLRACSLRGALLGVHTECRDGEAAKAAFHTGP